MTMTKMRSLKQKRSNEGFVMDMMPSFTLTESQIPEAKNWKIGKKYRMEVEVEMISSSKNEFSKDKHISHRFKLTKVGVEKSDDDISARRGN